MIEIFYGLARLRRHMETVSVADRITHHYYDEGGRYLGPWTHATGAPCSDCAGERRQLKRLARVGMFRGRAVEEASGQ